MTNRTSAVAIGATATLFSLIAGRPFTGQAVTATPPTPTYGTATVDGNPGEWNLATDFYAPMYLAGDPSKAVLANGYLRYDCSTQTLYVLVLQQNYQQQNAVPLLTSPTGNAWAEIDGGPMKEYTDTSGNDGTPPDFAWVGLGYSQTDSTYAQGYEASFSLAPGNYTIVVHVEALNGSSAATAAFVGFNTHTTSETVPLDVACSAMTASATVTATATAPATATASVSGPTATATATATSIATATATAMVAPASPTATQTASAIGTVSSTATNTATATASSTAMASATATKVPLADNGEPCTSPDQCLSMNCVEGVCCDTPCTEPDHTCRFPGREGTCLTVPAAPVPALSPWWMFTGLGVLLLIGSTGLYRRRWRH